MPPPVSADVTGLLLLINRLQQAGRALGRQTIVPFAELKLPRVAQAYEVLIGALHAAQFIQGTADEFTLTPAGLEATRASAQQHSLSAWFYNEYYQAIVGSRAHALFCERVYGRDLGQHGMADMGQIQDLLSELAVTAGLTLLDFGCGDGQISEYIAAATDTEVTGVDIADQAIKLAQARTAHKRERLRFYWADLERKAGDFPARSFDRILAIDSLFFAQAQPVVARHLLSHLAPGGQMGVFYLCPPQVAAPETVLAQALPALGAAYRVKDLSSQNTAHWRRKKSVLLELEPLFKDEGQDFLFKNRLAECAGLEAFQRYLYIITKA